MNYPDLLTRSAEQAGNIVCMGLDPIAGALPIQADDFYQSATESFAALFAMMQRDALSPAAFKPNLGYWQAEDRPHTGDFAGSRALSRILEMIAQYFPHTPVILDSKRGDIATSSANYAREAFVSWQADAVTVAPYMGSDSVLPFIDFGEQGVYILNRTSNPGGKDLQNLVLETQQPLYLEVARQIVSYNRRSGRVGAVVGATNLGELEAIAAFYTDERIPLLIPGVGSQGGSAGDVIAILTQLGYPLTLVRINSSSGLTHPWKQGPAPEDWLAVCRQNLANLIEEAAL